jgi:hypothetical protein
MIRMLVITALASLVVSTVSLAAALAVAGPDRVLHKGAWTYGPDGWGRPR